MSLYRLTRPLLWSLPPETAHRAALLAVRHGLAGAPAADDPVLRTTLWNRDFPNPVGLAAGFDKDAEAVDGALRLGFGFAEAGTVTPRPQPGNPQPRLFRLAADRAVINRLGFNGGGLERFAANFARRKHRGIAGANVGANRDSADPAADYAAGIAALSRLADYLVINVSSPNTPGLRALQRREALNALLDRALAALAEMRRLAGGKLPLIGCGGIASGDDAYAMIRAGASLVQLYTALVFDGPEAVAAIKAGLAARLKSDGFRRVADAVGADTTAATRA